jgi:hypothetical protein
MHQKSGKQTLPIYGLSSEIGDSVQPRMFYVASVTSQYCLAVGGWYFKSLTHGPRIAKVNPAPNSLFSSTPTLLLSP